MDEAAIKKYLAEDYAKASKFYDDRARSSKMIYRAFSIYLIVAFRRSHAACCSCAGPSVLANHDCLSLGYSRRSHRDAVISKVSRELAVLPGLMGCPRARTETL